jgi:methyltransferase (TIGR00027 family)
MHLPSASLVPASFVDADGLRPGNAGKVGGVAPEVRPSVAAVGSIGQADHPRQPRCKQWEVVVDEGQPGWTASLSAMFRAAHLLLDDEPKVFRDNVAMRLAGFEDADALRAALAELEAGLAQRLGPEGARKLIGWVRANHTVRQRYAEDELARAIQGGAGQYVVLGAGLDSFAYRRPHMAATLRIFEVDHPGAQRAKRARLAEMGVAEPANLSFVPVDFERQSFRAALGAAGYRAREPAFVAWLGVTQYLTEEATGRTLKEIGSLAPGSEVVFEYIVPEELLAGEERQFLAAVKAAVARGGQPWRGFFEPARLAALLVDLGFAGVTDLDAEALNARYFAHRRDGLRAPAAAHLVKARVGTEAPP